MAASLRRPERVPGAGADDRLAPHAPGSSEREAQGLLEILHQDAGNDANAVPTRSTATARGHRLPSAKDGAAVKRRAYRSPLRQVQAKATRRRIIEAADRLFTEVGYGATSIDQIAETAGVGRATVFTAVGGKAAVLRAAYQVALLGDDEAAPLRERPWARPVR